MDANKFPPAVLEKNGVSRRLHILKTVQPFFDLVERGDKTFEVRKFDRDFQIGDYLSLVEFEPTSGFFGKTAVMKVTHIMTHADHDVVAEGYVVMSMKPLSKEETKEYRILLSA